MYHDDNFVERKSSEGEERDEDGMGADGIIRCENCGVYGMTSEFCNGGRFCSKPCVAIFASKHNK